MANYAGADVMGKRGRAATLCEHPIQGIRLRNDQEQAVVGLMQTTGLSRSELVREGLDLLIKKMTNVKEASSG